MKLYYAPQSRAMRPRWLLEELGVPYEVAPIDLSKGDHKTPAHLKLHPHGAVPVLVDGNVTIFESAAICAYLADKYPEKKLAPAVGTPARAYYYQWMFYAMATLEPPVLQIFLNTVMLPEEQRSAKAVEEGRAKFAEVARVLSDALKGHQYLVGDQFSAADVMIASTLAWGQFMGLLADQPVLAEYVQRLSERPAYKKA